MPNEIGPVSKKLTALLEKVGEIQQKENQSRGNDKKKSYFNEKVVPAIQEINSVKISMRGAFYAKQHGGNADVYTLQKELNNLRSIKRGGTKPIDSRTQHLDPVYVNTVNVIANQIPSIKDKIEEIWKEEKPKLEKILKTLEGYQKVKHSLSADKDLTKDKKSLVDEAIKYVKGLIKKYDNTQRNVVKALFKIMSNGHSLGYEGNKDWWKSVENAEDCFKEAFCTFKD